MSRGGSPMSSSTARTPGWPGSTLSRGSSAAPIPAATSPWIVSSSLERKTTRGVPRRWVSGRVTSRTRS